MTPSGLRLHRRAAHVLLACAAVACSVAGCSSGGDRAPTTATATATTSSTAQPTSPSTSPRPVSSSPDRATTAVTSAPVRVAHTTQGSIGYRSVGKGSPIVLIMGFGGTLNSWAPSFVTALARTHRVITFDNSGIGRTTALPSPLTVTAMAGQTEALLAALRIGRADILGWSLGGMIAQALTIEHPELVSHLVLAATYPGDGTGAPPPPNVVAQLTASATNPTLILPLLFPAAATTAQSTYVVGILSWSDQHSPNSAALAAEGSAATTWIAGDEPIGRRSGSIHVPSLVADGADDVLAPRVNATALSRIHGSRQTIYRSSGHAFLFQDQSQFLAELTTFLH